MLNKFKCWCWARRMARKKKKENASNDTRTKCIILFVVFSTSANLPKKKGKTIRSRNELISWDDPEYESSIWWESHNVKQESKKAQYLDLSLSHPLTKHSSTSCNFYKIANLRIYERPKKNFEMSLHWKYKFR